MSIVCLALQLYVFALFGRIILSWFPVSPGGVAAQIYTALYTITEPVLAPLRRAIPALRFGGMGLDLSPMIVLFGITILRGFIGC